MSMFSSKTDTTESSAKDLDRVRLAKQKKPKKTKEKAVRKVARTVQDTIPYEHVHGKYIFEVEKNRYSVTYSFCSLPRKTQKTDKQNTKKSAREKTSWRI